LTVTKASTLSSTLAVSKAATLSSTLNVIGASTMDSTLTVTKASTLSSTLAVSKAATLSSTLNVIGASTMDSTLTVAEASTLSSTLAVSKAATLSSTLNVIGASIMDNTLTVSKASTLSSTLAVSKAATLSSTLNVIGASTFRNDISLNGNLNMDGNLNITGNLSVTQQDSTTVINTTVNEYTLIVTEDLSLNGNLNMSGNASMNGELYVNNTITVSGDILPTHHLTSDIGSIQKSFRDIYMSNGTMYNVDSTGNANSMSTNEGIITVTYIDNTDPANPVTTQSIQIGSVDNKTGLGGLASTDASFTLDIQGDLRVSQDVSLNSTLQVGNATTMNNTLNVVGNSTMSILNVNDTLTVGNASILSSTLNVIGDASFNSGLRVGGDLYATYPDTSIPSSAINGGILTIQHTSDTGDLELRQDINNVKTLQFDKDSGFDVSFQSVGVAKIRMNSTFKYWNIDGADGLIAEGLDKVNLISGNDIILTADNTDDAKSLSIAYDTTNIDASLNTKVDLSTDQSIGGHKTFTNDTSFNQDVGVTGKLSHTGLAITSGNEIDQIKTISQSLTITPDTWTDTNISGDVLASGIYLLSVSVNDNTTGGTHYNETYTGTLSWYSGTTNSNNSDEIQLHRSGENPGTGTIYLRTTRTLSNGSLKLQIYSDKNITNHSYEFKFRRFM